MKTCTKRQATLILFGSCMLQLSIGLICNCRSVFFAPLAASIGVDYTFLSTYVLIGSAFGVLAQPLVPYAFRRFDSRIVLGTAGIFHVIEVILMMLAGNMWMLYLAGIIDGVAGAFLRVYPVQILLINWFSKGSGKALGISGAFTGLSAAIANPILTAVLLRRELRGCFLAIALTLLCLTMPAALLLRMKPEEAGVLPYGEKAAQQPPVSAAEPEKENYPRYYGDSRLWLYLAAVFLGTLLGCYMIYLNPLGEYLLGSAAKGALLSSGFMVGNMTGKALVGQLYDRYGKNLSLGVTFAASFLGMIGLTFPYPVLNVAASFLFGICVCQYMILLPHVICSEYGKQAYRLIGVYVTMAITAGSAVSPLLFGLVIDRMRQGSGYITALRCALGVLLLEYIFLLLARKNAQKTAAAEPENASPESTR